MTESSTNQRMLTILSKRQRNRRKKLLREQKKREEEEKRLQLEREREKEKAEKERIECPVNVLSSISSSIESLLQQVTCSSTEDMTTTLNEGKQETEGGRQENGGEKQGKEGGKQEKEGEKQEKGEEKQENRPPETNEKVEKPDTQRSETEETEKSEKIENTKETAETEPTEDTDTVLVDFPSSSLALFFMPYDSWKTSLTSVSPTSFSVDIPSFQWHKDKKHIVYEVHLYLYNRSYQIEKRYSEFVSFAETLYAKAYITRQHLALPPKTWLFTPKDNATLENRRHGLKNFMEQLLLKGNLSEVREIRQFLQLPQQSFRFS